MASGHTKLHATEHLKGNVDEITGLDATQISNGDVTNTEFDYLEGVSGTIATQDYVDDKLQGLDWQESVIDKDETDPSSLTPSSGDRYIVGDGASGDWDGEDEKIAEYDGSDWVFITPDEGFAVWVEDEGAQYIYNDDYDAGTWTTFGSTQDHGQLTGLGDDDHKHYLLINGTRAMNGDLDMGDKDITNVGNVDGIDISAHDHDGDAPNIPNSGLENNSVTVAGNSVSLGSSTSVAHDDLSDSPTDAHHAGFVGLLDDSGTQVDPDGSDLIQFTDDGIINVDADTNAIDLSITESNISHDNIGDVSYNDHHGVGNGLEWDGSDDVAISTDGVGTDEIDESLSPTWTGTHDFSGATLLPPQYSQDSEPTISDDSIAVWRDSDDDITWLIIDVGGTQYKVEAST